MADYLSPISPDEGHHQTPISPDERHYHAPDLRHYQSQEEGDFRSPDQEHYYSPNQGHYYSPEQEHYYAPDEGLPEVVNDPSPQALTEQEQNLYEYQQHQQDKYHVVYDVTPKLPDQASYDMIRSPDDPVPGVPLAVVESTTSGPGSDSEKAEREPRICGLRRKIFFLVLIAVLVVLAAAIGGGVAGGVAAARSRERSGSASTTTSTSSSSTKPLPASQTTTTSSTSTTSSSTTSTSTAPEPTATFLNNQTGPAGFAFQGFSAVNFTGAASEIYREEGFLDLPFVAYSYVWIPNGTECCVTFCQDQHTPAGHWCDFRKRNVASTPFPRVYIWCDQHLAGIANGTCS